MRGVLGALRGDMEGYGTSGARGIKQRYRRVGYLLNLGFATAFEYDSCSKTKGRTQICSLKEVL